MKRSRKSIWFAVSAVQALERREVPRYFVYENVYLVRATTAKNARRRGEAFARAEVEGEAGIVNWDGRPGKLSFVGIRKVVECAADPSRSGPSDVTRVYDGVEATYSCFLLRTKRELSRFISGKPVAVVYEE